MAGNGTGRVRIATWNINSIRLRLANVARLAEEHRPDVICLQEIKVDNGGFPAAELGLLGYPHLALNGVRAYHGVAIASRLPLTNCGSMQWCDRDDGRHVFATLPCGVEIHNFYIPAGGDVPDPDLNPKFAHKLRFLDDLADWCTVLPREGVRRVLVGDLNVAPLETDVWSHRQLLRVVSHTPAEVERLERVMAAHGWVDAVRRIIPPENRLYTWWSYRARDWAASNRGRRLDHIWITPSLVPALEGALVVGEARGWERPSDHVPVMIDLTP